GDTFHALTSDRPYRKGMPIEKALQIIESVRGTQLCPDCVDVFLRMHLWDDSPDIIHKPKNVSILSDEPLITLPASLAKTAQK
ncbi:MAG TPA: hypothetical protein PLM29_14955, partial [Deltaproteobacteria bacterium]|nr:hypothetical protein [Deltaproteobacteria bacterium]